MECGIALFAGTWWLGLITWAAFAAVLTFVATVAVSRRAKARQGTAPGTEDPVARLARQVEEISRRLEQVEGRLPKR